LAGVVAVMAALVAVLIRTTSTAELAAGISWTLRPLRGLGLDVARFSRLLAWTVERVEAVRREASAVRDALRLRRPRVGGARGRLGFETAAARAVLWRAQAAADRNAEALYLRGGDRPLAVPAPAPVEWLGLAATGLWAVGWAVW
ncbi:MAG TPA: hypothetical protein VJ985_03950, partial [Gammaproteobacteria bacterium]|nr:hypothetical protein [Gammaproteobacteria bacterium]